MSKRSHPLIFILLFSMFLIVGCGGGADPFIYGMNAGAGGTGIGSTGTPSKVVATVSEGQVNLSWAPVADAASYTVYVSTDNTVAVDTYQGLADEQKIVSSNTSQVVDGLVDGLRYYFIVIASGNKGEGSASETISAVPKIPATAIISVADYGDITLELFEANSPLTVENFVTYADSGFYNNTLFHRVKDNGVIQGGGYESGKVLKSTGSPIKNESDNLLSNLTGTISMARLDSADSATAQFFINVADNTSLDYVSEAKWGYTVFGRVIAGMDVVNSIKGVSVTGDVPKTEVLISSIDIIPAPY